MAKQTALKLLSSAAFAAFAMYMTATPVNAEVPESADPIRVAINDWTGQQISSTIAGEVLKKMGYNVQYVVAGVQPQFIALKDGEIDVNPEVWDNNLGEVLPQALKDGKVENLGDIGLSPWEGWVFPAHVKEICPGLPAWEALKDCAAALATAETSPKGRLIDMPADWNPRSSKIIKGLGLPFETMSAGSEGAMIAEMKAAVSAKSPLLIWFWSPHWIESELPLERVTLPEYDPKCYDDPKWGANPNETWDCGIERAHVIKVASAGLKSKWPAAYQVMKDFQLTNAQQIALMKTIDVDKVPLDKAIAEWIEKNSAVWQPWIDKAKAAQ